MKNNGYESLMTSEKVTLAMIDDIWLVDDIMLSPIGSLAWEIRV